MIVPMKKISIIVQFKDADSAISRLRSLGLLHVENQQAPKGKDINTFLEDIAFVNSALEVLYETKFYVDQKGVIGDISVTRKIRQFPADFGICSFGEVADCEIIKDYTLRFIKEINYRGLGEMEFKYDARDGKYKFIELNPRSNHWISVTTANGNNLPLAQYEDFAGKVARQPRHPGKSGDVKWLDLRREIYYWGTYGLDDKSPYHLPALRQISSFRSRHITEAFMSIGDPVLSMIYLCICIKTISKKMIKHICMLVI